MNHTDTRFVVELSGRVDRELGDMLDVERMVTKVLEASGSVSVDKIVCVWRQVNHFPELLEDDE